MKFTTTLKKVHWLEKLDMIRHFGYFIEYKDTNKYWNKRIKKLKNFIPAEGVFLIGSDVKRAEVRRVGHVHKCEITPTPKVLTTEKVWALSCYPIIETLDLYKDIKKAYEYYKAQNRGENVNKNEGKL
jgi:hypothetical protein